MSALRGHHLALSDERGSVLVVATLVAAVFVLLGTVIIELGHTMEHRRHLQVQTDAAALAAAQDFSLCSIDPTSAFGAMSAIADKYGGFGGSGSFNQQVGTASGYAGNVFDAYQSRTYPAGSHPQDPDNIFTADTTQMTCGDPSDANSIKFFDVKATETGIHNVFDFGLSTTVNAHSRVELKAVNQLSGLLPLGVPSPRPEYVFATFVAESGTVTCTDQSDNQVPCEEQLTRGNVVGSQQQWVLTGPPLKVTVPTGNLGVRIRVVGEGGAPTDPCGSLYVECYDAASTNGVILIRGWDPAATAPNVHAVSLLTGTCTPDAYFTTADCSAGISADVNLGGVPAAGARVWATIDSNTTPYQLTRPASPGPGFNTWSLGQGIPISTPAGAPNPHMIELHYNTGSGGDKTFGIVQRVFEASSDASGPLALVQEYESPGTFGPYSYQGGTTHSLGVTVNTEAALLLSGPNDPPISLRVFKNGGSASRNQSIDCDPALNNLRDEIAQGCTPTYETQPPGVTPTCPFASPNALWASPQPWNCAAIQTGASVGQVGQGFSLRIFGDANPPNTQVECDKSPVNWIRGQGFDQTAHPDDKRVVPLFITPLGSFSGTGSGVVPVIDFGFFYVTGYKGDACEGLDPNQDPVPSSRGAYVYGHFVKYFPIDNSKTSEFNCNLTTITPCRGVLTR